jgi:teichuronic acid biosynthesis glycosyltransferase TuaC
VASVRFATRKTIRTMTPETMEAPSARGTAAAQHPSTPAARGPVLMVANMLPHEAHPGYGIFVKRQIDSLQAMGLECQVMFLRGYRTPWNYVRAALRMLRLNFSRHRPRIVHGHGGETALAVRWFVRGPVVVSYYGDDLLGTPRTDGSMSARKRLKRCVLRRQARLITATSTQSAEMESVLPTATRARNLILPSGVDRQLFRPQPRDEIRRQLGWPTDDRIALFAANPKNERKRYWLAEAACRAAEPEIGPIRLQVGWGFPPDEIPRLMAAADCLLLTSVHEGSPNVVKEAVMCDLPVVTADVGDVGEVLADVEPSWICAEEPQALADGLVQCLRTPRRSNGWERSEHLGEDYIAKRMLEFYDRALSTSES